MFKRSANNGELPGPSMPLRVRIVAVLLGLGLSSLSVAQGAHDTFRALLRSVQEVRGEVINDDLGNAEFDAIPFASEASTSRFLSQATFGATQSDLSTLVGTSVSDWLLQQFSEEPSDYLAALDGYQAQLPFLIRNPWNRLATTFAFWQHSITGDDQLRQRMVYALSQILVISNAEDDALIDYPEAVAYHQSLLTEFGFGNYRGLLEAMTYSPGMGSYLTYMGNQKEDPDTGRQPDENYAREILQLFTMGLIALNDDGTLAGGVNDGDSSAELYDNHDITGLAKVFTGLNRSVTRAEAKNDPEAPEVLRSWREPMTVYPAKHAQNEKTFLGLTIPENTSAEDSITLALDQLMSVASVGPFLSRQLIQRFTTSNPSPAYISRVTQAFNDGRYTLPNGTAVGGGLRGDLKATIAAILLDRENLEPETPNTFGKLREPVLRFTQWARAFSAGAITPEYTLELYDLSSVSIYGQGLAQHPFRAPSVFNFYRPGYEPPGTDSGAAGMTVPELQIVTAETIPAYMNFITFFAMANTQNADLSVYREIGGLTGVNFDPELARTSFLPDYSYEKTLADDLPELFAHLNLLLAGGALSEAAVDSFSDVVAGVPVEASDDWRATRVGLAVALVMTSADYLIAY
ncbi:DUF1800 domain-containing protein [Luminiphilus sp.]|nr:DUF1800 domain-containing protein [Luminiphilus sp.]